MFYYVLKYLLLGPVLRLFFRPEIEGLENIPREGGALMASNHLAVLDSFLFPLMVPRRITFPAKREYFTEPGLKGRFKKTFFTAAGQVPIDRTSANAAQAALDTCVRLLRDGNLVGIYPEGTRSPDGKLYKGKTGMARIALQAEAPIIPVAMFGTDKANPIGSRLPKPAKVHIKIGKPLEFSRYAGLDGDRFVERSITDEVMYELMELSGQTYVDVYAQKVKDDLAAKQAGAVALPAQREDRGGDRVPGTKAG
ncbi:lysophospholipid acyltransferase family protein [Sciscionella sediminilitoris]|uniref:lysophospholipid acyltransferase family protein n=1 Tax=Sciscionella sediminilitoris TaxID=1445613 RepID=UPI0004DED1D7|nr:lysophospholipid acyltransferase family protein [Sciscionella sp. SE31]